MWKRAEDPVGLVNEADTSSFHLVISCSRAKTREIKRQEVGGQKPGAGEWATPESPPGALLWKKEMATCVRLREPCGSEDRRDRREPYRGRNPHPQWSLGTVQSGPSRTWVQRWSCGRWTQKGVPRRVTRLWPSLSGAPAVATGSHCFAAGLPSRPMITLGDPSVLSNTSTPGLQDLWPPCLGAGPRMQAEVEERGQASGTI